ncbi:hypothetical protein ACHAWF_011328 [Thalassiosira exigua]
MTEMHSRTILNMAKGGVHGKKTRTMKATKKKKTKNPNKSPVKHRKTSKRDNNSDGSKANSKPQSSSPSTKPKISVLGEAKNSGPPWQVMGTSDMKRNVEAEKVRRERIRLGIDSPSAGNLNKSAQKADVSGSNCLLSTSDRTMLSWKRFNPISAPSDLSMVGAYLEKRLPPSLGVPEVAFLGRSNVGKSSLLNKLVSKTGGDTARVGKTPGATASVNLYALLGQPRRKGRNAIPGGEAKPILGFADLPGFGYAKLSKETKESVEEAAERYLGKRRELALGVLLVDSRRVPNADDRAVLAALFDMGVPLIVVATKSDKLKASEVENAMSTIREGLGLPDGQPLKVSGVTGEGVRDLWRIILDACEARVEELKLAIETGRDDGGVMRVATGEESDTDDFYDDFEEDEAEEELFEDGEDIYYDQGFDWVQGESLTDVGEGTGEMYDDFYDGDDFVDDDVLEDDSWNQEQQRMERESFKLKNLKKRAEEMERRGEV